MTDDPDEVEADGLEPLAGRIMILTETRKTVFDESDDLFRRKADQAFAPGEIKKIMANASGSVKSKFKSEEGELFSVYGATDTVEPTYNLENLAKLYDADPHHAAAVDSLVDNVVGLGYYFDNSRKLNKLRDRAAAESPDKKAKYEAKIEDQKQELDDRLEEMNQIDLLDQILEKIAKDRFTMGNGYIEVGRTIDGQIGYIGHVPAQSIRIRRARDGFVQYVGNKPIFFRNFGDRTTADPFKNDENPNELIHYKKYSPVDPYYGVPEVVSAIDAIAGNQYATKYNIEFFQNKAVPRYIIKTRGVRLDLQMKQALLNFFETNTLGKSHRSILVPLPGNENSDIEFVPVETGKQEASFENYTKANIATILARLRVPANRLGISEGSTTTNRDADKIFKETVCRPEQRVMEKLFGRIIRELSAAFVFKLSEYTLTDEDQQSIIDERDLKNGVLVPDERRTKLGLPPRPDGNGDEAIDIRSVTELQLESQQQLQKDTLASQEKQAAENRKSAEKQAAQKPAAPAGAAPVAQQRANANAAGKRQVDSQRSAGRSNAGGAPATRNAKGEGRKTP